MKRADAGYLRVLDALAGQKRALIRSTKDQLQIAGTVYYVSAAGDDAADGKTPETAWKTLKKVSDTPLERGDGVLFRRGDLFRGMVKAQCGVSYGAYGEGPKPCLYGGDMPLNDPALWEEYDAARHIWHLKEKILDCGTLVMNEGERHCRKLIPSYIDGQFVCRDDESRPFVLQEEMTRDLDLVCLYDERMTRTPSKGQDFPVPLMDDDSKGDLYLRCDAGNPGSAFDSLEAVPRRFMFRVEQCDHVTIDNLCMKYIGIHAVCGSRHVVGLHVTNCEIGWIGGTIQHYLGTDPNYPQGGRGTVTRYGNGVEIYGGCEDYVVENCYIYQAYDAGITHQVTTCGREYVMRGIRYRNNLIEHCVYSIEYFLEKTEGDTLSRMEDVKISGNILRFSGYGWGQQRHNTHTPAHIKGWSYENTARDFRIFNNLFDRAAYRMVHLVAREEASCPVMHDNMYVQHLGGKIGQYGANAQAEPENMVFDEQAEEKIAGVLHDKGAQVYVIE